MDASNGRMAEKRRKVCGDDIEIKRVKESDVGGAKELLEVMNVRDASSGALSENVACGDDLAAADVMHRVSDAVVEGLGRSCDVCGVLSRRVVYCVSDGDECDCRCDSNVDESQLKELSVCGFPALTEIDIGCSRFEKARVCHLLHLPSLVRVKIGHDAFADINSYDFSGYGYEEMEEERARALAEDRSFRVEDCGRLEELVLGAGSFVQYMHFSLARCDSLREFRIGERFYDFNPGYSFYFVPSFSLSSE